MAFAEIKKGLVPIIKFLSIMVPAFFSIHFVIESGTVFDPKAIAGLLTTLAATTTIIVNGRRSQQAREKLKQVNALARETITHPH